jgi:hypothetical protein
MIVTPISEQTCLIISRTVSRTSSWGNLNRYFGAPDQMIAMVKCRVTAGGIAHSV